MGMKTYGGCTVPVINMAKSEEAMEMPPLTKVVG